jgi:hypothetical protein
MLRAWVAAALAAGALAGDPGEARAYELWLRAQATGQAYQLRGYRLVGPDLLLGRRRYTQTLALRVWDIGELAAARRRQRRPPGGPRISWQSMLRVDHDFGSYTAGRIALSSALRRDAIDVIPELADSSAALALLYGYAEVAGLAADRVTVRLGRVLVDDGWGTGAVDGASARAELPALPAPVALTAVAGLRVREASPLGVAAYELDGTSGAGCREYVEGAAPGTGSWQLIDRDRAIRNTRLGSDFELCPQREVAQPTVAVTLATSRLRRAAVEVGYRRTWSRTVGRIGAIDRLAEPDLGLYPNEAGQAPARGVSEERIHARASGELRAAGLAVRPYASARASLLHAVIDRAELGARLERGPHSLEPALEHSYPTFDGDSIFGAFAAEPSSDARLGYRYDRGATRGGAQAWIRRYAGGSGDRAYAGGADAAIERSRGRWRARGDALWDTGYGGRRAGGSAELAWRGRAAQVRGRAVGIAVAPDGRRRYVDASTALTATWVLGDGVAIHAIAEVDRGAARGPSAIQTRGVAVLDLAFAPEP